MNIDILNAYQSYLWILKLFQNKNDLQIFEFFFTVYRVRGAVVGENLTQNGEYSSTVKNRQKCVTVNRGVVVKGIYIYILFTQYIFNRNIEIRKEENKFTVYMSTYVRMYCLRKWR
jgi:hypothetical protein